MAREIKKFKAALLGEIDRVKIDLKFTNRGFYHKLSNGDRADIDDICLLFQFVEFLFRNLCGICERPEKYMGINDDLHYDLIPSLP